MKIKFGSIVFLFTFVFAAGVQAETMLFDAGELQKIVTQLKEKVGGPVMLLDLNINPNLVKVTVQDPKKLENLDSYTYVNGVLSGPVPVQISGKGNLQTNLFNLDDVTLAVVHDVIKITLEKVNLEEGEVSHMVIKRNLPFSDQIQWRVFVNSPRKRGLADFNAAGVFQKSSIN